MKVWNVTMLIMGLIIFQSCQSPKKNPFRQFNYEVFKKATIAETDSTADTSNIFDSEQFVPGKDSLDTLLLRMDTLWNAELADLQKAETRDTADKMKLAEEADAVNKNIRSLEAYLNSRDSVSMPGCKAIDCSLFAEIDKSKQKMFLYIGGELKDSFLVSTGIRSRETPDFDIRPNGPIFTRYNSKKFPGGNYQGLGNMPYAVFIKGGYAIHGTTQGNFKKLGTKASHGCIRLHPDNAKIFNELVKMAGLEHTWVRIHG